MLDKKQIQAIADRAEKATEGPWIANCFRHLNSPYWLQSDGLKLGSPENPNRSADIGFAAQARQDIPALLSHISEIEGKMEKAKQACEELMSEYVHLENCDGSIINGDCTCGGNALGTALSNLRE